MNEEQFEQLISTVEKANQTNWSEYIWDTLVAAIVAWIVSHIIESYR